MDNFQPNPADGSFVGTKGSVSWSGSDAPKVPRPKPTFFDIHREVLINGRLVLKRFRIRMPGYTQKRVKRENHPYSKNRLRLDQGTFIHTDGRVFTDLTWLAPGDWTAEVLLDANDQIKLVNKLQGKTQGSDFNMSVFLGESRQTLGLLADSAIRIAKAGHHIKKLDIFGAARALFEGTSRSPLRRHDWRLNRPAVASTKNSANLWLELQYGWKPLLNDAEECAKSLAHALNVPFSQTVRASVRKEQNRSLGGYDIGQNTVMGGKASRYHRRQIIAILSEPNSVVASLGLLDPELVLWELTPFSFVADWFIPIGSWMQARGAASRLTGTFITTDKREAFIREVTATNPAYGKQTCSGRGHQLFFDRVISTSIKVPMPVMKPLEKVASWQHCANAIALVVQMFSPRRS